MKNKNLWLGMLALALVFGMTVVGCAGDPSDDNNDPKTLVITMPASIFAYGATGGFMVGVFPVGTTSAQAISQTGIVAGANQNTPGVSYTQTGDPVKVTIPLYIISTNFKWTGSGTFDLYAALGSEHYYKAGSVKISSAITNITISSANEITVGDNGGGGGGGGDHELPPSSGVNAISGKTYFNDSFLGEHIVFSVTPATPASGTYVYMDVTSGTYGPNDKFRYTETGTGIYSWNETNKTVTLKAEKINMGGSGGGNGSSDGYITFSRDVELIDRTGYRSDLQAYYNESLRQYGETVVNQYLLSIGFSGAADYINYFVDQVFGNKTYAYSFSTDGAALLMREISPVNKGINELSGQTYYGVSWNMNTGKNEPDTKKTYVFNASDSYTFTDSSKNYTESGTYSYDSGQKYVFLMPLRIGGKDITEFYNGLTAPNVHYFTDDYAYRAANTNDAYKNKQNTYNTTNKTIIYSGLSEPPDNGAPDPDRY